MQQRTFDKIQLLRQNTPLKRLENPPVGIPRYNINDEGYYSVTQILDDGKFQKIPPKLLLHSQVLGSVVHLQIENYFKNLDPEHNLQDQLEEQQYKLYKFLPEPTEEEWELYLQAPSDPNNTVEELVLKRRITTAFAHFEDFLKDHDVEVIWAEEIIWNPDYLYAGTIDLFCYLDGKLTVLDFKTSRFIDEDNLSIDNYTGQLSAYSQAIKTLEGEKDIDIELKLLHLDPLGSKFKLISRNFNFDVFLHSLTRFSQARIIPDEQKNAEMNPISEKELEEKFTTKSYSCPDRNCSEKSIFPFLKDLDYLSINQVKNIIKGAFHDKNNHYAIFHINILDKSVQKSFITRGIY
jgi:hypothetical protein